MTLIPLFWYTKGFSLIGIGPASMIFFLTPTAQFFLGLYYFNEPLIKDELISFAFISNYGNRVSKSKFLEILTTFSISGVIKTRPL